MTDADVDGAHIASLLMTFFYREMPKLIEHGHLFLAQPPLFRISKGGRTEYARDDAHRDELIRDVFGGGKAGHVTLSRVRCQARVSPLKRPDRGRIWHFPG